MVSRINWGYRLVNRIVPSFQVLVRLIGRPVHKVEFVVREHASGHQRILQGLEV